MAGVLLVSMGLMGGNGRFLAGVFGGGGDLFCGGAAGSFFRGWGLCLFGFPGEDEPIPRVGVLHPSGWGVEFGFPGILDLVDGFNSQVAMLENLYEFFLEIVLGRDIINKNDSLVEALFVTFVVPAKACAKCG